MNPAMNAATSTSRIFFVVALATCFGAIGKAAAEPATDSENGRYSFSRSANSMIRLDTRSGIVSQCNESDAGWACYAVPDERKALDEEIGRLQTENDKLKAQLASAGKEVSPGAAQKERKIEIPLPSDQDVDRVMSLLQRAWKRLVEMANQVQKDISGSGRI
jgi:predicted RNase H-like nuclease (RuvC/YqgF family)